MTTKECIYKSRRSGCGGPNRLKHDPRNTDTYTSHTYIMAVRFKSHPLTWLQLQLYKVFSFGDSLTGHMPKRKYTVCFNHYMAEVYGMYKVGTNEYTTDPEVA